jgi:polysaccharide pyruvyl transferase WcaK-like protein
MIGQSVGPLNSWIGKWVARKVFSKAFFISVRDNESKKVLRKIGVKNEISVSTDAIFGLKIDQNLVNQEMNKKCIQNGFEGYFVFSIRPWGKKTEYLYKYIVQSAMQISAKYKLQPVFVPFQLIKENDQAILNKIIDQNGLGSQIEVRKFTENIFEVISLISGAKFTLGVRLHSLLFSIISGTPFIGLSYSPKVKNFMENDSINLSEYILSLDDGKKLSENIIDLTNRIISERKTISQDLFQFSKNKKEIWQKSVEIL